MRFRRIGKTTVSAIGLGGMPLSIQGRPHRDHAIATVHAALDAGITLIDTADAYTLDADGPGHNEVLIAEALASYGGDTSTVLLATKGGLIHRNEGLWERNGSPDYLKRAANNSRDRLGVNSIGLYQFHRPDTAVEFRVSIEALLGLLDSGVVDMVGVSNVNVDEIALANTILDGRLASVQNRFSPIYRDSMPELEYCARHDIAFLPWSPLGGIGKGTEVFEAQETFAEIARELEVSPQRLTLAWELALEHVVIPIPGSTRPESITDSAAAADLVLTAEHITKLSSTKVLAG